MSPQKEETFKLTFTPPFQGHLQPGWPLAMMNILLSGQHILRQSQSCFALVVPEDSGLVFQPICYPRRLLLFMRIGERQWEGDYFWGCDPRSIAWIPCQILNTTPCLASEEPFPTWLGLASHIPHAFHFQHSLTRLAPAQDCWGLQLSQNISQRENSFHSSTEGRMHAGVCLVKPRLTLATGSVNTCPARTGLYLKSHS